MPRSTATSSIRWHTNDHLKRLIAAEQFLHERVPFTPCKHPQRETSVSRGRDPGKRVKILSLIETMRHGGAETVATNTALALNQHDVRFVHYSNANNSAPHQPFLDRLQQAGLTVLDPHWSLLQQPAGRRQLLGDWRPDVVLFHWWKSHPLQAWIEQPADDDQQRPIFVCVLHHQGDPGGPRYDHYIAVSPSQVDQLQPQRRARTTLIPNGIELDRYPAANNRDHPDSADDGRFVIGRISSLRPGKIPPDWVGSASGFNIADAHWVIAGDGSQRAVLQQQARQLGVSTTFSFPGYISEQRRAGMLASFDVCCYVTGNMAEAHPLSLMEASAAGIAIVAEPRGGIPDIIEHGVNGLLGSSPAQIAGHLHRLRADRGLRSELGAAGRQRAVGFSLQRQIGQYSQLLNTLQA